MNSRIIKFVAGAGKTTYSVDYSKANEGGLYLAFTNSVVDDARMAGCVSLTIDSLFSSFLIPKLAAFIPLVPRGFKIQRIPERTTNQTALSAKNIRIDKEGKLYNRSKEINGVTLKTSNEVLHGMDSFPNVLALRHIFSGDALRIDYSHLSGLAEFLVYNHDREIINLLKNRFSYIIIDEAQDLKGYRETFAQVLHDSDIALMVLGDEHQNVNNGGAWFQGLDPDETKNTTYRCPEGVCRWIRENLDIEIYGTGEPGQYVSIELDNNVLNLDDGSRTLLYNARSGAVVKRIIDAWSGPVSTIKTAKGRTINEEVVIVGGDLSLRNLYTAATRSKKSVYSTARLR